MTTPDSGPDSAAADAPAAAGPAENLYPVKLIGGGPGAWDIAAGEFCQHGVFHGHGNRDIAGHVFVRPSQNVFGAGVVGDELPVVCHNVVGKRLRRGGSTRWGLFRVTIILLCVRCST